MIPAGGAALALALAALAAAPLPPERPALETPAPDTTSEAEATTEAEARTARIGPAAPSPTPGADDALPTNTAPGATAELPPAPGDAHGDLAPAEAAAPPPALPIRLARALDATLRDGAAAAAPAPGATRATSSDTAPAPSTPMPETAASDPADGAAPDPAAGAAPDPAEDAANPVAPAATLAVTAAVGEGTSGLARSDLAVPRQRPERAMTSRAVPRDSDSDAAAVEAPRPLERRLAAAPAAGRQAVARNTGTIALLTPPSAPLAEPERRPVPPDRFVCRDPRVAGTAIPTLGGAGSPCGIVDPVRVTEIDGIRLDTPATLDCPTVRRIAHWVSSVARPLARRHLGSSIREIDVMGSYACRTRNHKPGGRISEHARGRALDVGGFVLADGRRVSVDENWSGGASGRFLRELHRKSCGLFMTVLGPESDRFHKDHFHLDTARRTGKPYCR